jgi:hypothetical protein
MQRLGVLVVWLVLLGVIPAQSLAHTWCATNFPNAVFCEDFDRYCQSPPPEPEACDSGSGADQGAFHNKWAPTGPCSSPIGLDTAFASSPPWGARTNTQEHSVLGFAVRPISDSIRNYYDQQYSSLMGTDLNPLVLEVVMNGQADKARYDNSFLSFGSGFATAPVNWAWSDWCGCDSADARYPIICQQETPPANCPPISLAPRIAAIAVGFVTYLDTNPCHCGVSGDHSPYNEHLSFFDGLKWYRLRQGLFPGSGDFRVRSHENRIKITIKTATLKVELTCPDTGEYSWCELPRDYMGCFSSFTVGYPVPCRLRTNAWICNDDPNDPTCAVGVPGGGVPYYDNLVVHGGLGCSGTGACCLPTTPDYTCNQAYYGDCESLGGVFNGVGSVCDEVSCCPALWVDHDRDGDADMADFGWFQGCLSGTHVAPPTFGCKCADFDHDGDVDEGDFSVFESCMRGPGVPATVGCTN